MFIDEMKTLFDVNDYKTNIKSATYVASEPIADDQFAVDTTNIAHLKSTNTKAGYFYLFFPSLMFGDIIEAECEVRSISGIIPMIAVDEMQGDQNSVNNQKIIRRAKKTGEWEKMKLRYVAVNDAYSNHRIAFGLGTVDVGEYYIRNIKAVVHRTNALMKVTEEGTNASGNYIKFPDGTLICNVTTTIAGVANTDVSKTIVHAYPFASGSYPQTFANISNVSGNNDFTVKNLYMGKVTNAASSLKINTNVTQTYTVDVMAIGRWK